MMNLSLSLRSRLMITTTAGGAAPAFSPADLFASGEEGAWYEPSTTTAFRSTTDLTPCGYGQSAGFLLDLSKGAGYSGGSFTGLGSELVTNGTFDTSDLTGWVGSGASGAVVSNRLKVTPHGPSIGQYSFPISVTAGNSYLVGGEVTALPGIRSISLSVRDGTDAATSSTLLTVWNVASGGAANNTAVYTAASTGTVYIAVRISDASISARSLDNISVRELPGNHATQGTAAARPILARVPAGGRRSIYGNWVLPNSVNSDSTPSSKTIESIPDIYGVVRNTARITFTNGSYPGVGYYAIGAYGLPNISGQQLTWSFYAKSATGSSQTFTYVALTDTLVNLTTKTVTLTTEWQRFDATFTNPSGNSVLKLGWASNQGSKDFYIGGIQLEFGAAATGYQDVVSNYDITEAGVTSLDYLSFDGSDDGMATPSIDFTATDKMSVFAGVEKEADAVNVIVELSASLDLNNGSFVSNISSTGGFGGAVKSTSTLSGSSTLSPAPLSFVTTTQFNISGSTDLSRYSNRVNGLLVPIATYFGSVGTLGNFGNYPIYIGSRGGSSFFFDGKLFSLIVRGAASTAQEISDTESYLASKSGVSL